MSIPKFKVENVSKGTGMLSLEKAESGTNSNLILLTFRSASGSLLFQGQLMKNVSKFLKHSSAKTYKVQRVITVISKKETGGFLMSKCLMTV